MVRTKRWSCPAATVSQPEATPAYCRQQSAKQSALQQSRSRCPPQAQVGVRVVRVRRKQAELSKNARLRKRLQKLRESRKLLGIHKVAPEPTVDDKLDALFARYDTDHNVLIDADELVKLLEHFIPPQREPREASGLAESHGGCAFHPGRGRYRW